MVGLKRKSYAPESMRKIKYAVDIYSDWRDIRIVSEPHPAVVKCDLRNGLGTFTRRQLCDSLCMFATKIVCLDDKDFPPKSVKGLIYNIQMHLFSNGIPWRLFDPMHFHDLRNTIDNIMKNRTRAGMGAVKKAGIISFAMEEILWAKQVLGEDNPQQLLFTVFYLLGLHCALRGGVEQRQLRRPGFDSQFEIIVDENGIECIRYCEDLLSKTNQGGLNEKRLSGKVVYIYPSENVKRDPVRLYKKYIGLLPKGRSCNKMYLKPRVKLTSECWFCDQACSRNNLSIVVKSIMEKASIPGYFTNHSLRRTAATRLFMAQVEEKIIKEITGHVSDCVRQYQKTPDALKRKASLAIYGKHPNRKVECTVTKPGDANYPGEAQECLNESSVYEEYKVSNLQSSKINDNISDKCGSVHVSGWRRICDMFTKCCKPCCVGESSKSGVKDPIQDVYVKPEMFESHS